MTSAAPSDPARTELRPVVDWLTVLGFLSIAVLYVRAIFFTPYDVLQGAAQKIYYLHPPIAIGGYVAVGITALSAVMYLWLGDERADRMAEASAEVGFVFITMVLVTGPLWAHRIWGAWWVWWDLRLTLSLFLWFLIIGYLVLRGAIDEPAMRGRYSAVVAVLAALLIPFVHLSVYFSSARLHPMPIVLQPVEKPPLPREMLVTFLYALAAFTFLSVVLVRARYRYGVIRDALAAREVEGGN